MIQAQRISSSYHRHHYPAYTSRHSHHLLPAFRTIEASDAPKRPKVYGGIISVNHENPERVRYAIVYGRYSNKWSFPKGHANDDEAPMECTKREILEETGIHTLPDPIDYIRVGYGNYYVFCLNKAIPLHTRDAGEISDTKWCTIAEMEQMAVNIDVSQYIKHWKRRNRVAPSHP